FAALTGLLFSPAGKGDPSSDSEPDPQTGITPTITVASGGPGATHIDAGLFRSASVLTRLWQDINGNGVRDPGEPGVNGQTVVAYDAAGAVAGTAVTATVGAEDGVAKLTGLVPGVYSLRFALPSGLVFTARAQGTDLGADSEAWADGTTGYFPLTSGQTRTDIAAGGSTPVTLSGAFWNDLVADGSRSGERGLAGARVRVLSSAGVQVGEPVTTDAGGAFSVTGLIPGTYALWFEAPAGRRVSPWTAGVDPVWGNSADPLTGTTALFTLSPGESRVVNAGAFEPSGPGIGGRVYADPDASGLQVSGPGLADLPRGPGPGLAAWRGVPGVGAEWLPADGLTVLARTVAGRGGGYVFPELAAAIYRVRVAPPGLLVPANTGNNAFDAADSDFDPLTAT